MSIAADGFDWDAGNRHKCQKHGLSIAEIEHVVGHAETLIVRDDKNSMVEARFIAVGRTPEGRYAFVSFTHRARDGLQLLRKVPHFKSDEEAEAFLEQDLTDYLHPGNFKPMHFEIRPKEKSINLRISEDLLAVVRENAKREGVPYQRYIRHLIERGVTLPKRAKVKAG
jgi:predicted DNA binding CopG/RHH family protein